MAAMIAPSLALMFFLNAQHAAQSAPGSTPDRPAAVTDCRAEYQRLMKSLDQVMAKLDAAERSHDTQALRTALTGARQLLVTAKAKVAACEARYVPQYGRGTPTPSLPEK